MFALFQREPYDGNKGEARLFARDEQHIRSCHNGMDFLTRRFVFQTALNLRRGGTRHFFREKCGSACNRGCRQHGIQKFVAMIALRKLRNRYIGAHVSSGGCPMLEPGKAHAAPLVVQGMEAQMKTPVRSVTRACCSLIPDSGTPQHLAQQGAAAPTKYADQGKGRSCDQVMVRRLTSAPRIGSYRY